MAVLLKWSGDNSTSFDHEIQTMPTTFAYTADGDDTRLHYTPVAASVLEATSLGDRPSTAGRIRLRLSALPTGSNSLLTPLNSARVMSWRLRLGSTGSIIIDGPTTNGLASVPGLPLEEWVTLRWTQTASAISLRALIESTGEERVAEATGEFLPVNDVRIGQTIASPLLPPITLDDIYVTDEGTLPPLVVASTPITTQRIAIIGDSLTAMGGSDGAYLKAAFDEAGISTRGVYSYGLNGKRIVATDSSGRATAQNIADARVQLGHVDQWIIALGTNDRNSDDAYIRTSVRQVLEAVGDDPVIWVGLSSKGAATARDIATNAVIQEELRAGDTYADWDSHIRAIDGGADPSPYWNTGDATHMPPRGYQERAKFYVQSLTPEVEPSPMAYVGTVPVTAVYLGNHKITFR